MKRLSIQDRILLLVVAVIVPFAAITFLVVERRLTAEANRQLIDDLEASRKTFQEMRRQSEDEMARFTGLVAELPYFKAAVSVYEPEAPSALRNEQIATIVPVAWDIMRSVDIDFLAVADTAGLAIISLSDTTALAEVHISPALRALERTMLTGGDTTGNILFEGELFQVSLAPMAVEGQRFGTLITGRAIDQALVDRLHEMTHSDILVEGGGDLLLEARGRRTTGRQTSADKAARRWRPGMPVTPAVLDRPTTVRLAEGRYVSLGAPILDPTGARIGGFYLQRSLDEALRHVVLLRRTMIGIWFGALFLALLYSSWFTRQIGRRIEKLVASTRKISGGDLTSDVPVDGNDELAGLGNAFNQMTRSLRGTMVELAMSNSRLEERSRELERSNRELQETQGHLVQAGKLAAIGEMSAGLAHELNQPLTGMKGFAQLLLRRLGADSTHYRTVLKIEQAADHMARIVHGLRDFSRKGSLEKRATDLNQVMRDSLVLLEGQMRRSAITVELSLAPDLPQLLADPTQLQQVVTNLLSNARDALGGRSDGRIRLVTRRRGQHLVALVEDNGPGIAPEALDQIFTTFFTTKGPGEGTGLGLSISRGIMENHRGRLGVRSHPGRTLFWLIVPIAPDAAADTALEEAA